MQKWKTLSAKATSCLMLFGSVLVSSCSENRRYANKAESDNMPNQVVQKKVEISAVRKLAKEKIEYLGEKIKTSPVEKLDSVRKEVYDFFAELRKKDLSVYYSFQLYEGILQDKITNKLPGRKVSE